MGGESVSQHWFFLSFLLSGLMFVGFIYFLGVVPPHLLFLPPFSYCGKSIYSSPSDLWNYALSQSSPFEVGH